MRKGYVGITMLFLLLSLVSCSSDVSVQNYTKLQDEYASLQDNYSALQNRYIALQEEYEAVQQRESELQAQLDAANEQIKELTAAAEGAAPQPEQEAQALAEAEQTPEEAKSQVETTVMVWVSKTGKKYHYSSTCSNMKNPSQISLSAAESRGLTPCSKCY